MHPILFKMGSFNLPTYGFLLVMAILVAIYRVMRRGRREGLDPNQLLDFCTWLVLVGVLVEVPVMLSVCVACNRTRHWFPASAPAS